MPDKIKYRQVKVNLRPEDYEEISAIAEQKGVTIAELFRRSVGAEIQDKRTPKTVGKFDPELLFQLKQIGNNLNQIARRTNEKKATDLETLRAITRIEVAMNDLLEAAKDCIE